MHFLLITKRDKVFLSIKTSNLEKPLSSDSAELPPTAAQRLLATKGISILLYHVLANGGYTPAGLLNLTLSNGQTRLGDTLDQLLPLAFKGTPTAVRSCPACPHLFDQVTPMHVLLDA